MKSVLIFISLLGILSSCSSGVQSNQNTKEQLLSINLKNSVEARLFKGRSK